METNQKKGQNRKVYHLKKHRKTDDRPSFNPRSTFREENEKPVLFQLGSIASYGVVSDVHHKTEPKTTNGLKSLSLSSISATSSGDFVELSAKERKPNVDLEHKKELLRVSSRLSDTTSRSQFSGVTYASLEPPSLSPTQSPQLQMMDREEVASAHPQRNLEKNLSTVSNESLFSLSIGDNMVGRDDLFSYRDFKPGEALKSGELLSFSPSIRVPVGSSDIEDKESEEIEARTSQTDSEDKSSNSNVSWRNLTDCNNLEEAPNNLQSFPASPITKKNKKKKKMKKKIQQQQQHQLQQQQKQTKKRCSWLCCFPSCSCKNTWSCFSCSWCGWPSCSYGFCCYKRLKCFSYCSWPSCNYNFSCCKRLKGCFCTGCFSCGWLFCCCCCSRSKKVGEEEHQVQNTESKTSEKWFCCFSSPSSS